MILLLNENFASSGTITDETDFLYNNKFRDVGDFTFCMPANKIYEGLANGTFIKFKKIYGIVRFFEIAADKITVRGYDLNGLLKQRVVHPGEWSGTPEQIVKNIVTENTTGQRSFPMFLVADIADTTSPEITFILDKSAQLDTVVNSICEQYDLGYEIKYNGTNIVFDTLTPVTRSNVIYGNTHGNFADYTFTHDCLTMANVVYNRAEPEGMEVTIDTLRSSAKADGLRRSGNIYVDKGTVYFESGASYTHEEKEQVDTWDTNNGNRYVYAYHNKENGGKGIGTYDVTPSVQGYEYTFLAKINVTNALVEPYELQICIKDFFSTDTAPTGFSRCEIIGNFANSNDEITIKSNALLSENKIYENVDAQLIDVSDFNTKWHVGDYIKLRLNALNQIEP